MPPTGEGVGWPHDERVLEHRQVRVDAECEDPDAPRRPCPVRGEGAGDGTFAVYREPRPAARRELERPQVRSTLSPIGESEP